ncbi:MAG TPA: FecR domain-containing protein [Gemmatimonadaceae bacterium]|jgi:transmembrane sensor|nr:FecR domain-containing protein [Gemmatimonadaceae bacterium]
MEDLLPGLSEARLDALIAKALAGEADAAELFVLRRWLGEHGVDLSRTALPGGVGVLPSIPGVDITAAWTAVVEQLNQPTLQSGIRAHTTPARPGLWGWSLGTQPLLRGVSQQQSRRLTAWSTVSVVLVGLLVFMGWHTEWHTQRPGTMRVSSYVTANGERAAITLPDGNTVMLNVGSRLDVPADYLDGNHTVRLLGEAMFTVRHREQAPFMVRAGQTTTRVLGTTFVVRHYAMDSTTIVAVRDGKVAVDTAVVTASWMLEAGPQEPGRVRAVDPAVFGFAGGILTLNSMPLSRALQELDRWYGADIRLSDSSLTRVPIDGKFTAGSLSDLSEILQNILDARVVRHGRVLTLFPRTRA